MSDPQEYTVGWICALSTEYTAARVFLDREHDPPKPECIAASDDNAYTLGEIADHKIAIAVLPHGEYGTSSAATVATNMLHSFPNIRVGLMVGVGGGAPTAENDIRLGDIVVSSPRDGTGGVYQYDYGKRIQTSEFKATGHLNQPPSAVLTAMNMLKSRYETDGHRIHESIEAILESKPRLKKKYGCPGREHDVLYASNIVHPLDTPERDCRESCTTQSHDSINNHKRAMNGKDPAVLDHEQNRKEQSRASETPDPKGEDQAHQDSCEVRSSNIVYRQERSLVEDNPAIHYGTIASGNSLIKDAHLRDEIAKKKGIMCFEMEAAGLMNRLPCLVVRGICDYSDSHKNKEWQGYAAMTASAYTKDLLMTIKPWRLEIERRLKDVFDELSDRIAKIGDDTRQLRTAMEQSTQMNLAEKIRDWLSPSDALVTLEKARSQRHPDTCRWLLDGDLYRYWRTTPASFLWLYGISGCGKTFLASSVIDQLRSEDQASPLAFFYFDVNGGGRRDLPQMLRSLLFQLRSRSKEAAEQVQELYEECRRDNTSATIKQLSATLKAILHKLSSITVVIDALDECDSSKDVVTWLEDLCEEHAGSLHLLVTSQKYGVLDEAICGWPRRDQLHCVDTGDIDQDIKVYVHTRLFQTKEFEHLASRGNLQEEVENTMLKQINGMFRLAACQLDVLSECIDQSRLMTALNGLPKTLQEIYHRILNALEQSSRHTEVLLMLQFLTWSEIPITIDALTDAIAVQLAESPAFKKENRPFRLKRVILDCSSLVSVIRTPRLQQQDSGQQQIQLAHSSVKEYLRSSSLAPSFYQHLEEVYARRLIAKTCISYLLALPIEHFSRPDRKEFPFAATASSWMDHARVAETTDDALIQLILRLYRSGPARLGTIESSDSNDEALYSLRYHGYIYSEDEHPKESGLLYEEPLNHASYWGLETIVRMLLEAGADVDTCQSSDNPLHAAAYNGHENVVRILLQSNANANGTSNQPLRIPLIAASFNRHLKIVQILVQGGASIYARTLQRMSAFNAASISGNIELLRFLLETSLCMHKLSDAGNEVFPKGAGENLHIADWQLRRCVHRDQTPKSQVDAMGGPTKAVAILQAQAPACTHFCLNDSLHAALIKSDIDLVELLIEYGADPRGCTHDCGDGRPPQPLSVAIEVVTGPDFRRIINLLREKGAEFDARAFRYDLLDGLEWRAQIGDATDVKSLLELAGDVALTPRELGKVRKLAIACSNNEVADLLLKQGAEDVPDELSEEDNPSIDTETSQSGDQGTLRKRSWSESNY
ncbi:hypothetical protein D6C92_09296 [Aureobasidium pullulans]|nr:hypothetical protein D6C92_09296 [Aureobasidium pullulans]